MSVHALHVTIRAWASTTNNGLIFVLAIARMATLLDRDSRALHGAEGARVARPPLGSWQRALSCWFRVGWPLQVWPPTRLTGCKAERPDAG